MPNLTEAQIVEQLDAQHTKYRTGASGTDVQDDQDAREVTANATHTEITNASFTVSGVESPGANVTGEVYDGGDVVMPIQATYMEARVRTALDADLLHTQGGPYTSDYSLASPYVDGMYLIQGSLLTGEKMF